MNAEGLRSKVEDLKDELFEIEEEIRVNKDWTGVEVADAMKRKRDLEKSLAKAEKAAIAAERNERQQSRSRRRWIDPEDED